MYSPCLIYKNKQNNNCSYWGNKLSIFRQGSISFEEYLFGGTKNKKTNKLKTKKQKKKIKKLKTKFIYYNTKKKKKFSLTKKTKKLIILFKQTFRSKKKTYNPSFIFIGLLKNSFLMVYSVLLPFLF